MASDGLPFAFTIHTFSSVSKPCTYGHANVLAEITSLEPPRTTATSTNHTPQQNQYRREESDARHYDIVPSQYPLSDAMSPLPPQMWDQIPSSDTSSPAKDTTRSFPTNDASSDSRSTFSFNSANRRAERGETRPGSDSAEIVTADLTAFIRVGEEGLSRPRHRGHLQARANGEETQASTSGQDALQSEQEQQPGPFCEQDMIWEMHYPDLSQLERVIASRKHQTNDERDVAAKRTYTGDTDSEEGDEEDDDASEPLQEMFRTDSPGGTELQPRHSRALVPYSDANKDLEDDSPFTSAELEQDPWSHVATAPKSNGYLTQSMEVNLGDDEDDAGKKWGGIRRLSGLMRRLKNAIGNNAVDSRRLIEPLPTIHDGQELEDSDGEELSGYYTCDTPSPTAMQRARSITPTREPYAQPSSSDQPLSPDASVILADDFDEYGHDRHASVDSGSGALSERNLMLAAPHTSLASAHMDSVQNVSWDETKSFKLPIKDLGNGQYLALGHLSGVGEYKLTVKIGKKQIRHVPKIITVVDPTTLGSGIGVDGPFFQSADSPVFPSASTMLSPHPEFPPCHSVSYDNDRLEYALQHSHVGHVDILFVVDCTSSMGSEIRQLPMVVEKIEDLMKEVSLCKRLRMGVVAYRDHHPEDEDNFLLRKHDFTENIDRIKHFIHRLEADGGDDYPEAMEVAFEEAAEGVRWSPYSAKFVLWVGDAPPHGYQGFRHKEAVEEERKFKDAKARLKKVRIDSHTADIDRFNVHGCRQHMPWTWP